ncbi:MAG TPA: hypothetical protein VLA29_11995 [Acidimicrobiia bacterium]|nr:hypothetical protein [Acidimicrobiia bacterium]
MGIASSALASSLDGDRLAPARIVGGGGQPLSPPPWFVGSGVHEVEGFKAFIGEVPESHLVSGRT